MVSHNNTSLGLPEAVERAGAYVGLFVTGIFLLITERNPNVRHHAKQSIAVSLFIFAPLFLLFLVLNFAGALLGWIPLIGGLLHLPFALLAGLDKLIAIVLWLGLMLYAGVSTHRFVVPGTQRMRKLLD